VHPDDRQPATRFQAIVFDLDGTLVDSSAAITASVNHVRAAHHLPPLAESEVRRHVGRGPVHLLQRTVGGVDLDADLALYKTHHPSVLRSGTHLLPGVAETLSALRSTGLRLAVCSNKLKAFTRDLLDYLGLASLFEVVIGPEDTPRLKPAPDMLLAALARLQVPAGEVLYVGDMVVDIQTARAAGVAVWVVATGSNDVAQLQAGKPDRILQSVAELRAQLTHGFSERAS
jgi:phosphoglycolate phosphatase